MLTQREKLEILIEKIKKHDFFDGPYMISREESQVILRAMKMHHRDLDRGHKEYLANRDEINQKSKERYQQNRDEIKAKKKQRRKELEFQKAMEAINK